MIRNIFTHPLNERDFRKGQWINNINTTEFDFRTICVRPVVESDFNQHSLMKTSTNNDKPLFAPLWEVVAVDHAEPLLHPGDFVSLLSSACDATSQWLKFAYVRRIDCFQVWKPEDLAV